MVMKNQRRSKLALRKETVRELDQLELQAVAGGVIVITQPPTCRICLTTPAP